MNPAILKALIISGGTLGVGVPGMYYGYPHISNLINPEVNRQDKKPAEESTKINPSQEGDGTDQERASKDSSEEKSPATGLPSGAGGNDAATNLQIKVPGTTDSTIQVNQDESNTNEGGGNKNTVKETGTSLPGGTSTPSDTERSSEPSKQQ